MSRYIKFLVVHCTATSQFTKVSSIQRYWREELGWKSPGYHVIIEPDGTPHELISIDGVANGVAGYNSNSIHISYIGGVDPSGNPVDNRTDAQKQTILRYLKKWKKLFPSAKIQGHRDFPNVKKACPSFSAIPEYASV